MNRRKDLALMAAGILLGTALAGPAALAVQRWPQAVPSTQTFYLNGIQVEPEAYTIEGRNYVQLAELGELLGVAVSYRAADNSVHLSTKTQSVGAALRMQDGLVALPTDGSRYIPQAGDQIPCADGSIYRITDVSRWDSSPFASGPLASLPEPTCDWTSFPAVDLPEPEIRRYRLEGDAVLPGHDDQTMFGYWQGRLTEAFLEKIHADDGILVNLASSEMKRLFDWKRIRREARIITPEFRIREGDRLKTIVVYTKMCRGEMTRHLIRNRIADPEMLKEFEWEGFRFDAALSRGDDWTFTM